MKLPSLAEAIAYITPTVVLGAIGTLWKFLISDPRKRAEARADKYERLWQEEVKLGARRALMPRDASDPPPAEVPMPEDWVEDTAQHEVAPIRKVLEKEVTDEHLRRYVSERTPPRATKMFETKHAEVIIIDDDEATVRALHRLVIPLVPKEWRVAPTTDPEEGRLWLLEPSVKIAIIDLCMRGLPGDEIIREMLTIRPELRGRIIVCSGAFPDDETVRPLLRDLGCLWLGKPSSQEQLRKVVATASRGQ